MAEIIVLSRDEISASSNSSNREISKSASPPINLASERLRLVRTTIAGARPVMPDDTSRRTKVLTARKIWHEGKAIAHSAVGQYLSHYGVDEKNHDTASVRYHPAVLHEPTRRYYPAMLAPVHDLAGEFVGIHRTYLMPDGSGRAPVSAGDDRRMLGNCFGSYVQLKPMQGFRLVITESVEAALVVQQSCPDLPVWASMTLGNMKAQVPDSVKEIIFCTDGNNRLPGIAEKIIMDGVREHMNRGLTVLIAQPLPGFRLKDMRLG